VKPEALPSFIRDAEAEYARRGAWERVFPCTAAPTRYLDLFEAQRYHNIALCAYCTHQIKQQQLQQPKGRPRRPAAASATTRKHS
jgi:hypothetical protein